jgi:putative endonuclease
MRSELGFRGEQYAADYLNSLGYLLVERNFRTKFGEIDLIYRDGETWVFVEVKTKTGVSFGTPEEMFGRSKFFKVKRMAQVYLKGEEKMCRIDVVAVVVDQSGELSALRHHKCVT